MPHRQGDYEMKAKAIRIQEFGGPEVLEWTEIEVADPAEGVAGIVIWDIIMEFGDEPVPFSERIL